jgi:hypothetical protein
MVDAFRHELSDLGWIEGKNIRIEYRFAESKPDRLPELAAELVRLKVDIILVTGATGYYLCRQDSQRRQIGRSTRGAAEEV